MRRIIAVSAYVACAMLHESERDLMFSNALEGRPQMPNRFIYQFGDTQSDGIQMHGKLSYVHGKLHGKPQFNWIFRVPHLVGRGPSCQRQDLISQANAENWCVRSMLHDLRKSRSFFKTAFQIYPSSVSESFASNWRIFSKKEENKQVYLVKSQDLKWLKTSAESELRLCLRGSKAKEHTSHVPQSWRTSWGRLGR